MIFDALTKMFFLFGWWRVYWNQASKIKFILVHSLFSCMTCNILLLLTGKSTTLCCTTPPVVLTGDSYKWYASVAGLPNLYSVIDENTFYMKQAVPPFEWSLCALTILLKQSTVELFSLMQASTKIPFQRREGVGW